RDGPDGSDAGADAAPVIRRERRHGDEPGSFTPGARPGAHGGSAMTLTQSPVSASGERRTPPVVAERFGRRRSGRSAVVAAGVLVLVVMLVVLAGQAIADPLAFDGGPLTYRSQPGDERGVVSLENVFGTEVSVGFERGGTFSVVVGLVNHGRYPV